VRRARSRVLSWTTHSLHRAGLTPFVARLTPYLCRTPVFHILMYHRVNDDRDPFFPSVPVKVFEQQMAYIARTYRVLTVEDLADRSARGKLPSNALAVTLDDGYRDNLTHAAPILARYGLPATVFLATGFIGTAEVPWFDRLAMALKATKATSLNLRSGITVSLGGEAERLCAMRLVLQHLKRLHDDERRRMLDQFLETLAVTDQKWFKNLMLSWDDVHALRGLGFSIGAHTVNHPILSRVSTERAWTEIVGSRTMIESACGALPRAFAYPSGHPGDYTETVTRLVRDAGFKCAVTAHFGVNTRRTSLYELHRGGSSEHDLAVFALKLAWYQFVGDD